jgi:hypothetical protein
MPRKAKTTLSGQPAQPIGAVAGQMYGAGVEQMALQRQMPAPQVSGPVAPPAGAAPPAAAAPEVDREAAFAQALSAAKALQGQTGSLRQTTMRPMEPLTAGLTTGPGPGPEALQMRTGSPAGDTLRMLSQMTNDPLFAELARKAGA